MIRMCENDDEKMVQLLHIYASLKWTDMTKIFSITIESQITSLGKSYFDIISPSRVIQRVNLINNIYEKMKECLWNAKFLWSVF
jgi:hypothetical protein